ARKLVRQYRSEVLKDLDQQLFALVRFSSKSNKVKKCRNQKKSGCNLSICCYIHKIIHSLNASSIFAAEVNNNTPQIISLIKYIKPAAPNKSVKPIDTAATANHAADKLTDNCDKTFNHGLIVISI
ncbi:MAG: hypothetical protein AABZ57_00505, partial [Candidatus Margulisiibacteriota bacterium]